MRISRRDLLRLGLASTVLSADKSGAQEAAGPPARPQAAWPPELRGARNGVVTLCSDRFLETPEALRAAAMKDGAAPFTVARTPPTVDLAFHGNLGPGAIGRRLWSSWGDICVAADGKVYCGIGDHADDAGGDARCFIYRWDPARKLLEQVVDMNRVVPPQAGQPAWSKVHAKIDEGPDGKIYFSCTLNDGNRCVNPNYRWTERLPGGQLYRYDPATGQTAPFADLPRPRCTATSLLDRERNIWWCNLEGGPNALWGLNLESRRPMFQGEPGSVHFNRNFALTRDGSVVFNGDGGLWRYDAPQRRALRTRSTFAGSPGMRSSTAASRAGDIFGTSQGTGQLFRYRPAQDELQMLGPSWLRGDYVTVSVLSPDERFVYYLPGAHGQATRSGTPVIQYDIAAARRKVIAFLAPAFEQAHEYVPAGTYGVKLSSDGGTLYVNFNGHPTDRLRPRHLRANGFGLCAFAAIHIPREER